MVASQLHLVRHGEVHNPERILYGRLPGYRLSELGQQMAEAAAADLAGRGIRYSALLRLAAAAHAGVGGADRRRAQLPVQIEPRIIEPPTTSRASGCASAERPGQLAGTS